MNKKIKVNVIVPFSYYVNELITKYKAVNHGKEPNTDELNSFAKDEAEAEIFALFCENSDDILMRSEIEPES